MEMKSFSTIFIFIFVIFACSSYSFALALGTPEQDVVSDILAKSPFLTYLGRVESKRFFHINDSMTWYNANEDCEEIGMQLVAIENQSEYNFLRFADYPIKFGAKFWIAARDDGSRAQYRWTTSGQPLGNFAEWDHESATKATCIFMQVVNGGWREYGCNYGFGAVCQLV